VREETDQISKDIENNEETKGDERKKNNNLASELRFEGKMRW